MSNKVKTLNYYIERLKPAQQDLIVALVKEYCDRPDFHKGLLPFLPCDEAERALKYHLEDIKAKQAPSILGLEEQSKAVLGERFIRQTISVFADALLYQVCEDAASEIIHLKSVRLKRRYGTRFTKKFYIRLDELVGTFTYKAKAVGLIELQMVARNKWKVTADKGWIVLITEWLHDEFG